jgi:hypothetical protein
MPLFEPSLALERWTREFFISKQAIFLPDENNNSSVTLEDVQQLQPAHELDVHGKLRKAKVICMALANKFSFLPDDMFEDQMNQLIKWDQSLHLLKPCDILERG